MTKLPGGLRDRRGKASSWQTATHNLPTDSTIDEKKDKHNSNKENCRSDRIKSRLLRKSSRLQPKLTFLRTMLSSLSRPRQATSTQLEPSSAKKERRYKAKRSFRSGFSVLLPQLLLVLILGRFSWEMYSLHTASWPDHLLFHHISGSELHHRFLGNVNSTSSISKLEETLVHSMFSSSYQSDATHRVKRPPPFDYQLEMNGSPENTIVKLEAQPRNDLKPSAVWSPKNEVYDWKKLCEESGLSSTSRVLITDVIRQSAASLTALVLAKQCNVRNIAGTDALFPNLRVSRLRYMQIYKKLFQEIPNFRFLVTEHGLHRPTDQSQPSWLLDFDPTHILVSDHLVDEQDVSTASAKQNYQLSRFRQNVTKVSLPRLYGPGVSILSSIDNPLQNISESPFSESEPYLHVDDGLASIIAAFRNPTGGGYREVKPPQNMILSSQDVETVRNGGELSNRIRHAFEWNSHLRKPYGTGKFDNHHPQSKLSSEIDAFGSPTKMPCSSNCGSKYTECELSAFDGIIETSRKATSLCRYVVYLGNFSNNIETLASAEEHDVRGFCRVAFVAKTSVLVQRLLREKQTGDKHEMSQKDLNGQISHNGWLLLWPTKNQDQFGIADSSLLRIDPSKLFSPVVQKALFLSSTFDAYAKISNKQAMALLSNVDAPGLREGAKAYQQHRSGTHLSRWVHLHASKPRHAVFLAGSAFSDSLVDVTPAMFVHGVNHSKKQLAFYQQMAHWVHTNQGRPQFEVLSTVHKTFPFQWIAPFFMVHNLQMEEARLLRCEWLEEHISWGEDQVKGQLEELSLAFVLGRRKSLGLLGGDVDPAFGRDGWAPFLVPNHADETLVDERGGDVFVHLLKRKSSAK